MDGLNGLPQAFCERMKKFMGDDYKAFLSCYDKERHYGLRYNPLKDSAETFVEKMPFDLEKISWAEEGYYYQAVQQPGRHVLHEAGAYYIQEPSAMAVAEILDPQPGERILDLCAAPGGKSTQIAGRMRASGLLVSNEIMPERAKILLRMWNGWEYPTVSCAVRGRNGWRHFFQLFLTGSWWMHLVPERECSAKKRRPGRSGHPPRYRCVRPGSKGYWRKRLKC